MEPGCRGATVVDLLQNRGYSKSMMSRITGSDYAGIARDHLYLKLRTDGPVPDEWLKTVHCLVFDDKARHWLRGKVKRILDRHLGTITVTTEMMALVLPPANVSPKKTPVVLEAADGQTKRLSCDAVVR